MLPTPKHNPWIQLGLNHPARAVARLFAGVILKARLWGVSLAGAALSKIGNPRGDSGRRRPSATAHPLRRAVAVVVVACLPVVGAAQGPSPAPVPLNVLMIGNSYTDFASPSVRRYFMADPLIKPIFETYYGSGLSLKRHADQNAATASRPLTAKIKSRPWDVIVLQDQSDTPQGYAGSRENSLFWQGVSSLNLLIKDNCPNPNVKIVYYCTWPKRKLAWPGKLEDQKKINMAYEAAATNLPIKGVVAYCGDSWLNAMVARPDIDLYFPDGTHPNPRGQYLAAACLYQAATGRSLLAGWDGTDNSPENGIDAVLSRQFQDAAHKAMARGVPELGWFKAESGSSSPVKLSWANGATTPLRVRVERASAESQSAWTEIAQANQDKGVVASHLDLTSERGRAYRYRIRGENVVGFGAYSQEVTVQTPPMIILPPTDLVTNPSGRDRVRLDWKPNGATRFRIQRRAISGSTWNEIASNVGAPFKDDPTRYFHDDALLPSARSADYAYRVCAVTPSGDSDYCPEVVGYLWPSSPNVTVATAESPTVTLTWTDDWDNETAILIDTLDAANNPVEAKRIFLPAGSTRFVDNRADLPNTVYKYRVHAVVRGQPSFYFKEVAATTGGVVRPAPYGFKAIYYHNYPDNPLTNVALFWEYNAAADASFQVERRAGPSADWQPLQTVSGKLSWSGFVDRNLTPGTAYEYRVRAVSADAQLSRYSDEIRVTTGNKVPLSAAQMRGIPQTGGKVSLSWEHFSGNVTGFKVQRKRKDDALWTALGALPAGVRSFEDQGLLPTATYEYEIRAYNSTGSSLPATVAVNTLGDGKTNAGPVAAPQSVNAVEDVAKVITLTGSDVDGTIASYAVSTAPVNGTVTGAWPSVTYTPRANFAGPDSFEFTVTDNSGAVSAPAKVNITVGAVNDAPSFVKGADQTVAFNSGARAVTGWASGISAGPSDESAQVLSFSLSSNNGALFTVQPAVSAVGALTFTPAFGKSGTATVTLSLKDDGGTVGGGLDTSASQTFTIVVSGNSVPVATPQSVSALEDVAKVITLTGSDVDGTIVSYAVSTAPANGTVTGTWPNVAYTPRPDFNGTDSFEFTVTDNSGGVSAPAKVSITVGAVNDAPVALAQSVSAVEEIAKVITLTGSDVDGTIASYAVSAPPVNGTVTGAWPIVTYTPKANFAGPDSFEFTVTDNSGAVSPPAKVSITVGAVNDAPVALAQSVSALEDVAKVITLTGSDVDGTIASSSVSTAPVNGMVTGTWPIVTYTPKANFAGPDSFEFTVTDNSGAVSAPAKVNITVGAVNDAPSFVKGADQTVAFNSGARAVTGWASGISAGPSDESAQVLSFSVSSNNGALFTVQPAVSAVGALTFTPAFGKSGSATVTLSLKDDGGTANGGLDTSASQTFTIVVSGNSVPVAMPQSVSAVEDVAKVITLTGSDVDGTIASYAVSTAPVNGMVTGTWPIVTYTPKANFAGPDSFEFTVTDNSGGVSAPAKVSITVGAVNDGPVALAQSVSALEDVAKVITLTGSDVDGTIASYAVSTVPANGTVTGAWPSVTYTPRANFAGPDSFEFTVTDNSGGVSAPAKVNITVGAVNDAPSFVKGADQTVAFNSGARAVTGWASGISAGPSDESAQVLSFSVSSNNGALFTVQPAVSAFGALTFTAAPGKSGSATVTLSLKDDGGTANGGVDTSASQTFTIVVSGNSVPVATPQSMSAVEDVAKVITLTGSDVDGTIASYAVSTAPANGTVAGAWPSVTYTPRANFAGPDSFEFTVTDNSGAVSAPAKVSITVGAVNDAPVALAQSVSAVEDVAKVITLAGSDVDGTIASYAVSTAPANGTVAGAWPSVTYTPRANFAGPDSFEFTVTDNSGAVSAPAKVSITVGAVNDAPVALAQSVSALEDVAKVITLAGSDVDGTIASYAVSTAPVNGTVAGAWPSVTYTPKANFNGTDSFEFTVTDNSGAVSAPAKVSITVGAVNDAPVALAQSVSAVEDVAKVITLTGSDVDGTIESYAVSTAPANGTVAGAWPSVTYTPRANFAGTDSFEFTVTDNSGAVSPPAKVSITVGAVNDAPSFVKGADQTVAFNSGARAVTGWASGISAGPSDESAQVLSFSLSSNNGALFTVQPAVSAVGALTFTAAPGKSGSATVTLSLKDDGGTANGGVDTSASQTFTIVVSGNSVPVATPQSVSALEDVAKVITLTGSDVDGTIVSSSVSTAPVNGTVTGTWPNVTYTPRANFAGPDSFEFTVTDNSGAVSAPAKVNITVGAVNDAPSFVKGADQTVAFNSGARAVTGWASGISAGPSDESAQVLSFSVSNNNGALFTVQPAVSAVGALTFTAAPGKSGSATVTLSLKDDGGTANGGVDASASQTFTIVVSGNSVPVATPQSVSAVEDVAKVITLTGSDVDGTIVSSSVSTAPVNGTVTGTWPNVTYTPKADFNGTDSFEFTVTDNSGAVSAPAKVSITVGAVNDAPSFVKGADQTVAFNSGRVMVNGWASDISAGPSDESAQTRIFSVSAENTELFSEQPDISATGTLTYIPALGKSGTTTVTVSLRDNGGTLSGGSDTSPAQTFRITVQALASTPTQFDPIANLSLTEDAGPQTVSITGVVGGAGAALSASSDNPSVVPTPEVVYTGGSGGSLVLKPVADASGSARITVTLSGGAAGDAEFSSSFSVAVAAVNDAPSFESVGDVVAGKEVGAQSLAWASRIKAGPVDESGQKLTFETVVQEGAALFEEAPSVSIDGTLRYRPRKNGVGHARVKVRLKDDGGVGAGGADASGWKSFSLLLTDVSLQAGSYSGLMIAPAAAEVSYARSGRISVELRKTGAFTARLELGAEVFSTSGVMDNLGRPKFGRVRSGVWMVVRRKAPPMKVALQLDTAYGSDRVNARVDIGDSAWSAGGAERRVAPGAALAGQYTAVLEPSPEAPAGRPGGLGWATLNVQSKGGVRLAGRLADGTSLSCAGSVSKQSRWPLYGRPTSGGTKAGLVSGWVQFADKPSVSDLEGADVKWLRFAMPKDRRFPGGWSEGMKLGLLGSRYIAPTANGSRPLLKGLSSSANNARLTLSGGDLRQGQAVEFALKWPYATRNASFVLGVNRATGHFTGTLAASKDRKSAFSGVILQNQNLGGGFWLSAGSSGLLRLEAGAATAGTAPGN